MEWTVVVETQWLATQRVPKSRKSAKKSVKYFHDYPCLPAKESHFPAKKSYCEATKFISCCRYEAYPVELFALPSRFSPFPRFFAAKPLRE
jgi:hypothetical protein